AAAYHFSEFTPTNHEPVTRRSRGRQDRHLGSRLGNPTLEASYARSPHRSGRGSRLVVRGYCPCSSLVPSAQALDRPAVCWRASLRGTRRSPSRSWFQTHASSRHHCCPLRRGVSLGSQVALRG